MSDIATFVDECIAGRALVTDADDWVDDWHDAPDDSPVSDMPLAAYLGMNEGEYGLWVERPETLRFIIAGRKSGAGAEAAEMLSGVIAAAARADNDTEAVNVVQWLRETGRL